MTTKPKKVSLYDRAPGLFKWLQWFWFALMCLIAFLDENVNFVYGIVALLVLCFVFYSESSKRDWIANNRVASWIYDFFWEGDDGFGRIAWRYLSFLMIFLFVAGNGLFGKSTTSLVMETSFSKRVLPSRTVALHVPVLENMGFMKDTITFTRSGTVFTTADDKSFVADVEVTVSLDGSIPLEQLLLKYGSLAKYREAYTQGILDEFQRVASLYTLEQIAASSNLLLEDHIGTNMGLAPYGLRWSGVLKVTNVHMTAAEQ